MRILYQRLEGQEAQVPAAFESARADRLRLGPSPAANTGRSDAVVILQVFAVVLMLIPSDAVVRAIGAAGYAASLIGMMLLALWIAATAMGFHDPLSRRNPVRFWLAMLWLVSLVSYASLHLRGGSAEELSSADRWLMLLAAISGVVLVAAECLTSLDDIRRVLRALVWAGAICGLIAALQFWVNFDVSQYLRMIPGFSVDGSDTSISSRGALSRVAGTAIHPIELGVVAGMLLPLAIYLALSDGSGRRSWLRWVPVACIGISVPASVSRSAIVSVTLAVGVFIVLLPAVQRVVALAAVPFAVVGVFMVSPGVISTLTSFFVAGSSDPSVSHRTDNYPYVEDLVRHAPWFGGGGGTYIRSITSGGVEILDNQFLKTSIELGLVGLAVLALFFLVPVLTALSARQRTADPNMRALCAALAGAALAAAACSATFDSLSFPMFAGVQALVFGLIGACWCLTSSATERAAVPQPHREHVPSFHSRLVFSRGGSSSTIRHTAHNPELKRTT